MAYNLQSLITILEKLLDKEERDWPFADHNRTQVESLFEKAVSLQQILEKPSLPRIQTLEIQIRDAAHRAEDIVESHMADSVLLTRGLLPWLATWCKCFLTPSSLDLQQLTQDLQQVTQDLDSAMEQVVKLVESVKGKKISSVGTSSSSGDPMSKTVLVGVEEDLLQLRDRLTGTRRKLEVVPIVGMGGIGKTTLARKLFQDPAIVSRFVARAWTTVSQDYNMRVILSELLRSVVGEEEFNEKHSRKEKGELVDVLYQGLYGRRYMIVLDDVWSSRAWEDLRRYFPDNNNGSRIVITTRESDVATYAAGSSQSLQHKVQLLTGSASWDLLRQIVFGEGVCPSVLRETGERIASGCGGLPLAIKVIGGILSKVQRSKHVWEGIGKDVRAAIVGSDEQLSNILSLSYEHLPNPLKPCFLCMAAFDEDQEIMGFKLIWMWLAEGFIKPSRNCSESLEEVGEDYLKALVQRNLLSVKENRHNGKPMSYIIHDLLRDLCLKKAGEEKFLHVSKDEAGGIAFPKVRRVSVCTSRALDDLCASTEVMSLARTLICSETVSKGIERSTLLSSRLLRVLDIRNMFFRYLPKEVFQLVNLRFLAFKCFHFPTGISRLSNLQILIARIDSYSGNSEIWEMTELRHAMFKYIFSTPDDGKVFVQMKKMQSINTLELTSSLVSRGFFESIPNIKTMGIYSNESPLLDLSHLQKLETLSFQSGKVEVAQHLLSNLRFPSSLRELTLYDCHVLPREMSALSALPNLEFLMMDRCWVGEEWEVGRGEEFTSLRILHLEGLEVERWRADETNFPKLGRLVIRSCRKLEEIPSAIGEIATLQEIDLIYCRAALEESARRIQDEQCDYGNYTLKLGISYD